MNRYLGIFYPLVLIAVTLFFFTPFIIQGKLPIPSDTIIGLYHPFRDMYANAYPNGIPYKNFLITDPVRQQYPWRFLSIDLLKKGNLPLWNPYNFAGAPLLGNFQNGSFYPLNFLFLILPFPISWSVLILLAPLLAGLFMYLYLRRLRLTYAASFAGGLTYAFCGFSVSWMEWGTITQVALWLPLILLSKEHLMSKLTWRWAIVLLFADVSAVLAGHVQTLFYLMCISISYVLLRSFELSFINGHKKVIVTVTKRLVPFIVLGILLLTITAFVWIPSIQFILLSARNIDQLNGWQQPGWFIPWQNLIQFIAPDFFGNPATLNYWGVWNYGEFIGYVGILPLIMALFALFFRRDKKTYYFGILFLLSLIFSLPTIFAKLPFILNLPFISTAQPTRLLFAADFSLSILCALGLDYFIRSSKKWIILSPLLFVGALFFLVWIYIIYFHNSFPTVSLSDISVAKHNLYFPTVLYALCAVILSCSIFIKNKKAQYLFVLALLMLTVFDLLRFAQKFTPFTNPAYLFPPTASLSYLQQQPGQFRIMETDNQILPPNFSVMYHLESVDGYDPLYLRSYGEFIAAIQRGKPDIKPPLGFNRIITPHIITSPFINLLGVKYILSLSNISMPQFSKVYSQGQTIIYKNNNAFPRAFFVNTVLPSSNENDAMQSLFRQENDLGHVAIVEGWNNPIIHFANGTVNIVEYSADKIILNTSNNSTGFLVFTDTYYPTWHAQICNSDQTNCMPSQIYLTDYTFRGITVPSGMHSIVFTDTLF